MDVSIAALMVRVSAFGYVNKNQGDFRAGEKSSPVRLMLKLSKHRYPGTVIDKRVSVERVRKNVRSQTVG